MRSKAGTYLLIVCIISIWGIVGYKLVYAFNNSASISEHKPKINQTSSSRVKQNFELYLNYPDPFLDYYRRGSDNENKATNKNSSAINVDAITVKSIQKKELGLKSIQVKYKGLINNLSKKGRVAIIEVDGIQQITYVGDTFRSQQVTKITPDSICFLKGKTKIWIYRI